MFTQVTLIKRSDQSKVMSRLDLERYYLEFHSPQHWSLFHSFLTYNFPASTFPMWNTYANKIIFDCTRMTICPSVRFLKWLEGTFLSLDLRLVAFIVANSHMARWWWHEDFYDLLGYGWHRAHRSAWSATGPSHSGASQEHLGTELVFAKSAGTWIEWKTAQFQSLLTFFSWGEYVTWVK